MQRTSLCLLVGLTFLAGSELVAANQTVGAIRPQSKPNPYDKLFQVPALKPPTNLPQPAIAQVEAREPRVVCGMSVLPLDPSIDPKMIIHVPQGNTHHTMRVLPPPACK